MVKVVPVFKDVYESFGAKLPAPTQALINLSDFMRHYLLLVLIGLGATVYGCIYFIKTKAGRDFWDRHRIRLPIFGPIAHKICLVRFTRTLASLIRSGVPILEVLQIVSQTVGNTVMEKAIKTASGDIERGEGIATALGRHAVFPSMIVRMVSAGEQTGNIDNMLERVANFLDEEVEAMLSGLMSLLEPLLIVFLGLLIGSMVICMYLPIFNLGNVVSGHGS
jgi:type IV pilus assembly protein PilC